MSSRLLLENSKTYLDRPSRLSGQNNTPAKALDKIYFAYKTSE